MAPRRHRPPLPWVLGVDAGGTKTVAVVADRAGRVRGIGLGGAANFQVSGAAGAEAQIRRAIGRALLGAKARGRTLAAVCYGVAGADRPPDFETIRRFVAPIVPARHLRLENDTVIALRAGTADGVGIALIAGTGSNAIGRNIWGEQLQVGGLGPLSGDFGSAGQLALSAVVAAMMGQDGRAAPTALLGKICGALGLQRIEDLIALSFADRKEPTHPGVPCAELQGQQGLQQGLPDLAQLAPLVFEAAQEGDAAAARILQEAGVQIARAVRVITQKLFPGRQTLPIVFGGSVFQKGQSPILIDTVARECRAFLPRAEFVKLAVEPVLGAVAFALDDAGVAVGGPVWPRLIQSFQKTAGSPGRNA